MALHSIEEIIEDIRQGKMVILMDDEDRENEGDLIMAADKVTPEAINFMATFGRGLICQTMTKERCQQLNLPLMVTNNNAQFSTNFTVSIEAATGVTTGISAHDRAVTVQAAVAKDAKASDLVQPGHIFPLMAQDGGVLIRAGHTEAGCDLARLAGCEPSGVIVEILNDDGTMARCPDLEIFSEKHGIKMGTIADLIEYRNTKETTVVREAECKLPTRFGEFNMVTFRDTIDNQLHYALLKGDVEENCLVRVHLQNTFNDLFHSERDQKRSWPLENAMERIASDGGVLVLLANHEHSSDMLAKVKAFEAEDNGQAPTAAKWQGTSRQVGVGSQILSNLGVSKMRLLSSPKRYHSLSGFGLEVTDYIAE
ncbi:MULTISPECIES: bifunctional 3,4-dihydroxy-2-butanone-4-phosphate synthase/GTP cyclohydrolase II [unclassified Shewanella]|uniref:bifunctional 3,4-dihydroxy-2-butanone-4-phosphate synthase/GTP cyclohydrolase II n=1 Tax=unclassified Shewanella TaxID=196818 RepID=UPI000C85B73D|nr:MULTISPECIES: bifunctional 3,4-dihydroxy-2-butanone-4-phosphate synthase/GTP cyclohydrolase II [unclassified Shewanella]MDO6620437.1 bifunctional 3,4-dihydroxy-2-butanone-4-phosphate synthase/GTP cyclohydrolase II [Shewanella sp. 6_MG-2023]MDO6679716.1 bifunctional 3,4-dihydroxy-2-butanone-4-phosphate synthase/GTP cyclohydrolase II [Shewanella sp. 4_MG-2023]MDO6774964.1 bifunctional 3,4-dihydroxy-2-butanone-4-phosphate synthase/GTP cyclohydrolase II [Shewanella sp. 3_MG-2023]PMG26995.1 3,4-d